MARLDWLRLATREEVADGREDRILAWIVVAATAVAATAIATAVAAGGQVHAIERLCKLNNCHAIM